MTALKTPFHPLPLIAEELKLPLNGVQVTIALLDEGGTVPFIARYRKDRTGALDEVQIQAIVERLAYWRELEARRQTIRGVIAEQGKLTPELERALEAVTGKTELEDLYLPYKPRRRTRAQAARELGLEPLAVLMRLQQSRHTPEAEAQRFVGEGVADPAAALAGARDILAEEVAETASLRERARRALWKGGLLLSRLAKGVKEAGKFADYAEFQEGVARIPSHRYLALRRGEDEKILRLKLELPEAERLLAELEASLRIHNGPWGEQLRLALQDSWQRLLLPSLESEILAELKQRADNTAIEVFAANLREILMAAPFGEASVIGLDPGLRTGVKMVALSATGQLLEHSVLYLIQNETRAGEQFSTWLKRHRPRAVAIGDGTGSRETEQAVRRWVKQLGADAPQVVRVSEAGASIYSASEVAREEFPELDLTVRGAVSIGRRLQDPLAELVKIEPKSLGVGQYQHDVEQKALAAKLEQVVESCVNQVGVELNTASAPLLARVAGLSPRLAKAVVEHRDRVGAFAARSELRKVKGLGPKSFEQAAGFLRIRSARHPLDRTAVHPEHYALVEQISRDLGVSLEQLLKEPERLTPVDWRRYASAEVGEHTLRDILAELRKPGRDPRQTFEAPQFREDIQEVADLRSGMVLEGRVTNITAFGAFVDVGVHQDGLVHISQLSERFVKDPHTVVRVGQVVRVKVLEVDVARKRIQLSARC
ncbi:MAG: Tex family protein [Candidatus Sericytochromatia bacterium]